MSLVWGDEGGGLDHIITKHIGKGKSFASLDEAAEVIDEIIRSGKKIFENGDRIVLKIGNKQVTIRKNYRRDGKKIADKNWVLTAYDETAADSESPVATIKGLAGSATDVSVGKDITNKNTDQTNRKEISEEIKKKGNDELNKESVRLSDIINKPNKIDKLKKSVPVKVTPNDYSSKYNLDANSAQKWIKDNLRGEYTIKDTGEKILLSKVGAEEVTSHSRTDLAHIKSVSVIPTMLENAIFLEERPNTKNNSKFDSYRYYAVGMNIDGVDYTAKVVIGVKQGKKYYDHRLTQIEKTKLIDS